VLPSTGQKQRKGQAYFYFASRLEELRHLGNAYGLEERFQTGYHEHES